MHEFEAVRQGDLFFTPITENEAAVILPLLSPISKAEKAHFASYENRDYGGPSETRKLLEVPQIPTRAEPSGSRHAAQYVLKVTPDEVYVKGYVAAPRAWHNRAG